MYVHITDNENELIHSTLPELFKERFHQCNVENETFVQNGNKYRHGKVSNKNGSVYLLAAERNIVERPRLFREKLNVYLDFIHIFKDIVYSIEQRVSAKMGTHNRRLLHNLTTLNGHNIQELFNVIPEQELRVTKDGRKKFIADKIKEQIQIVPEMIMNIMKNNAAIKMEFSVAEKLYGTKQKIKKQRHNVRKALMNILHLFFQDFTDKEIYVEVEDCDVEVMLNYESFLVAIYQLFDNATKYALNNSNIKVSFFYDSNDFCLAINMTSLKIESDELDKLTIEGFCGRQAKKIKKNGKGIGMYVVKKVLSLNNARLEILPQHTESITIKGVEYGSNRFIIKFPKQLVVSR
jgi:signal transduction histidine kinase